MTQQETVDTNTDVEGKVPPGLVDQVHEERVSASVPPLGPPDSSQEEGTDHFRVPGTTEINNKPQKKQYWSCSYSYNRLRSR